MAIPDRESIRRKLDSLGPAEVKRRLEIGAYAANKIPIVNAWLNEQESAAHAAKSEQSKTLLDRLIEWLKNQLVVAIIILMAIVLAGVAQVTDSITKITGFFRPTVSLPTIPGDSGWLLLGDLNPSGDKFVRGPFYVVEKSNYSEKSLIPRKGEQVRLTAERNVVIAGYKTTGLANQLLAPWRLNVISDSDYTGIKLPKDAVVEVRDVGLGSFPSQPIVVWVRVAAPPK